MKYHSPPLCAHARTRYDCNAAIFEAGTSISQSVHSHVTTIQQVLPLSTTLVRRLFPELHDMPTWHTLLPAAPSRSRMLRLKIMYDRARSLRRERRPPSSIKLFSSPLLDPLPFSPQQSVGLAGSSGWRVLDIFNHVSTWNNQSNSQVLFARAMVVALLRITLVSISIFAWTTHVDLSPTEQDKIVLGWRFL